MASRRLTTTDSNFRKSDRDGSGKATLRQSEGGSVSGVLFSIEDAELPHLDRAEGRGKGYERFDDVLVNSVSTKIAGKKTVEDWKKTREERLENGERSADSTVKAVDVEDKVISRSRLQGLFDEYVNTYKDELVSCETLHAAFIRKFDGISRNA